MYKLKYYDYWGAVVPIPKSLDRLFKTKKQAWWWHYNNNLVNDYNQVVVVEVKHK